MKTSSNKLFEPALVQTALIQSFVKLDPRVMIKNPVMFTVEVGTVIMAYVTIYSINNSGQGDPIYNFAIFLILLLTVLFANFAEAIAEARGKAQADSLRKTREETPAKVILANGNIEVRSSNLLLKGMYSSVRPAIQFQQMGKSLKVLPQ
jgi:K+-transporting ATPase ATPase B chain